MRDGLQSLCQACDRARNTDRRAKARRQKRMEDLVKEIYAAEVARRRPKRRLIRPDLSTKDCTGCNKSKPKSEFHRASPDGRLQDRCKECVHAYYVANTEKILAQQRKYYAETRPAQLARSKRYTARHPGRCGIRAHGITEAQFKEMADAQGGVCAICRCRCDMHPRLSIDHWKGHCEKCASEYACGQDGIRGLLCNRCNQRLVAVDRGRREPTPEEKAYLDAYTKRLKSLNAI